MWLMTRYGFFSAVLKPGGEFQVRARARADLENLCVVVREHLRPGYTTDIKDTPGGDYPHRMAMNQAGFAELLEWLAFDVDYGNFKSMVAKTPSAGGPAREALYHDVWATMRRAEVPQVGLRRLPTGGVAVVTRGMPSVGGSSGKQAVGPTVRPGETWVGDAPGAVTGTIQSNKSKRWTKPKEPTYTIDRVFSGGENGLMPQLAGWCRQCGLKAPPGYITTCGRSECQEAEARANAERAKPKKRVKKAERRRGRR